MSIEIPTIDVKSYQTHTDELCSHTNTIEDHGVEVCMSCGTEVCQILNLEPETRYYGSDDTRYGSDPSRCSYKKTEDRTIFKDIQYLNLPDIVEKETNRLYNFVTKDTIKRGNYRKIITFACVLDALRSANDARIPADLQKQMGLTKKEASKGINFFSQHIPKSPVTSYLSPVKFIPNVMNRFKSSQHHIDQIEKLYNIINNRSRILNSSNPESVISGLAYYYIRLILKDITCARFSKIVKLSDITISKIAKEISRLLGTTDVVKLN